MDGNVDIFNCVDNSNCMNLHNSFKNNNLSFCNDMVVPAYEIHDLIQSLPNGKAAGKDTLTAEHLKYCDEKIVMLLSLFVTSLLIHGYIPNVFIETVIVPIVKNKNKRISDKSNYRPIGLSNICSKLLEGVLLNRIDSLLSTTHNQFGFKPKHGTDMCV